MAERKLEIVFLGRADQFKKAADDVSGKLQGIGKVVGAAALAGGAAAVGIGAASVKAFGDFDEKMREVYTLLPGISKDAMKGMQDDVKDFSKEFGVLPNDVVPALYSSLSAGVPPDNVFDFLETAQKAAKGGVTDLNTAVDGISSVVNAYGDDVISAAEASDLMFTAVRLGKTDFEQLSANISKVTPVANALGIGFEDVTAGLATLTAQGTPTAEATTQMNSLFAELGKTGTVAAKSFEDAAGKSFPEFIASGGNVAEALDLMKKHGADTDTAMIDMFGSIEAGKAAMALSGSDAFANNLEEMGASAGATDAAFETMSGGINDSVQKIKAHLQVLMLEIGERLAPLVERFLGWLVDTGLPVLQEKLPEAIRKGREAFERIRDIVTPVADRFRELGSAVMDRLMPPLTQFIEWFRNNESAMQALGVAVGAGLVVAFGALAVSAGAAALAMIAAAAPVIALVAVVGGLAAGVFLLIKHWDAIVEKFPIVGQAADVAVAAFDKVREAVMGIVEFIRQHWDTIARVSAEIWNGIWTQLETTFGLIVGLVEAQMAIIQGVIDVVMGLITGDWDRAWDGIKQIFTGVWDTITELVGFYVDTMTNLINTALGVIDTSWGEIWGGIRDFAAGIWDSITGKVGEALGWIETKVSEALGVVKGLFSGGMGEILGTVLDIGGQIITWHTELPGKLATALATLADKLMTKGREGLTGLWDGAKEVWAKIKLWFIGLPGNIVSAIGSVGSLLFNKGKAVLQGFIDGMKSMFSSIPNPLDHVPGGGLVSKGAGFISSPFRAAGGPVSAGRPYIVGERGMELFVPGSSGHIVPNHALGSSGGRAAGGVHVDAGAIQITINGNADPDETRRAVERALERLFDAQFGPELLAWGVAT